MLLALRSLWDRDLSTTMSGSAITSASGDAVPSSTPILSGSATSALAGLFAITMTIPATGSEASYQQGDVGFGNGFDLTGISGTTSAGDVALDERVVAMSGTVVLVADGRLRVLGATVGYVDGVVQILSVGIIRPEETISFPNISDS